MKKSSGVISLGDVAEAAGVSKAAACYALQNRVGVSATTRERVIQVARQLGYVPDARIASWMIRVREAKEKELLPIVWLNNHLTLKDVWHKRKFLSPYLDGARERALQLGYRLEEIWAREKGMTLSRLGRFLYRSGIEGVIVTHYVKHLRLDWSRIAGVALEGDLIVPSLNRVLTDHAYNARLALRTVKRLGYQRIGICLHEAIDSYTNYAIRGTLSVYQSGIPASRRVRPLFHQWGNAKTNKTAEEVIVRWIETEKPDVIIGHSDSLIRWAESAGLRVPDEVGIVHLATDDDVSDWAGVYSNRREIGASAVNLLLSNMHDRRFGVPRVPMNTYIRGEWKPGRTLLAPKPR